MALTNFDFRNTHFEIKQPTKINKEPDFESLSILYDEIKRCAQNVPSNNGGGNYGHLGLVVTNNDYQLVSIEAFVRPQNPGEFAIPAHPQGGNYTADKIQVLKSIHEDAQLEYQTVQQVEAALKQFIVEAIQPDYLEDLRNPLTRKLEGTIPFIMTHLFTTYGKITAQSVLEKQLALVNMNYDTSTPILKLFAKAQEYQKYASVFGDRVTPMHFMTIIYNILRKTGKYNSPLQKWNEKAETDKTWENFKNHFRQASTVMKEFNTDTAADAGYANLANDITQNLANLLKVQDNEEDQKAANKFMHQVTSAVNQNQTLLPQLFHSMNMMNENINTLQNNMNAMKSGNSNMPRTSNQTQPNRNTLFQQMPPPPPAQPFQPLPPPGSQPQGNMFQAPPSFQQMTFCPPVNQGYMPPQFQSNQQFGRGRGQGRGNGNNNNGGNGYSGNNQRQGRNQQRQKFYCWTHGVCFHPGVNCMTPAQGHQPFATFQNPMNGNMKGMSRYMNPY